MIAEHILRKKRCEDEDFVKAAQNIAVGSRMHPQSANVPDFFDALSAVFPCVQSKVQNHKFFRMQKRKHPKSEDFRCFSGAAGQIRTADLILTKDALYLLSYSSGLATEKGLEPSTSSVTG